MKSNRKNWTLRAAPAVLLLGACSFDADNPAAITEEGLENPIAIESLVNGVIGDYDFAYQRSALYSGLLSDELRASGSWTWWHEADKQGKLDLYAPTSDLMNLPHHWWRPLSRARFLAEETYARIQRTIPSPETSPLTATVRLYSGMAYRDIGEYFCVAAYDGGPAVQPAQTLEIAEQHLTEALTVAQAAKVDSIAQAAQLVRARVRFSRGNLAGALEDARAVKKGFQWFAHFRNAANEDNNMVFQLNSRVEATVQEPFQATGDPRVPVQNTGKKAADNATARFDQVKLDRYLNMPLAKWQEARLIEAEILLLQGGQVPAAVALLNEVRAAAKLEALSPALTEEQTWDALKRERKMEFFLEGQRMLDMRRFREFPAGWQASCSPLPLAETGNNPNFKS